LACSLRIHAAAASRAVVAAQAVAAAQTVRSIMVRAVRSVVVSRTAWAIGTSLMLCVGVASLAACRERQENFTSAPKYLRSATYFGDEWAANFWNSEDDHLEEELEQIADDGFNSIILVVPWREFQPQMEPFAYNSYALEKLDRVMEAAKAQGLWVSLRVGYTWDYWNDGTDVRQRFRDVMGDKAVLDAWDDYVSTVYERAAAHGNLYGGFITWEDFWSFTYYARSLGHTEESVRMAQFCGYTDYVRGRYSLEELERLYSEEISDYSGLWLPGDGQAALALLYEFFDRWLNDFLAHCQTIFPDISMEVRMDADQVPDETGELYWYGHDATYGCADASYTALMYGVPIGHLNQGERLGAEEALTTSREMLDGVLAHTGGKKLYIEQFLYMDNTPGFEHNAQIRDDEVDDYIIAMADVLKDRVMGYGVWAYRNYADNALYNPQFALGEEGWRFTGGAQVVSHGGSSQAELPAGGMVANDVSREGVFTYVRFTVDGEEPATVEVTLGNETQSATAGGGEVVELIFQNGGQGLSFTADRLCYIDNVKVYGRVQEGQLYTLDGEEGTCIKAVRRLNRKLR